MQKMPSKHLAIALNQFKFISFSSSKNNEIKLKKF